MNKHVPDLVAVPAPGDLSTYDRLNDLELAAYALWRHILSYRDTPALPALSDYREAKMALIKSDIADMQRIITNG